jgi:hypothetical protein
LPLDIQAAQAPQSVACSRTSSTWNFASASEPASPTPAFLKHVFASAAPTLVNAKPATAAMAIIDFLNPIIGFSPQL